MCLKPADAWTPTLEWEEDGVARSQDRINVLAG